MNKAYLLIGGNMGDRKALLDEAEKRLETHCGTIENRSALYETAAWGLEAQDSFLNKALLLSTPLTAPNLLHCILEIEIALGRKREKKFGPRLIDIDILLFNNEIVDTPELKVPHPELQNRRFALQCLNDVAPQVMHPILKKTIKELLQECIDPLEVHKF